MEGQLQPSGTDYIIHVLGDSQRVAYLQKFQAGGFDLVQTPSYKVTSFERWSRNANWWFYRELYRYWVPVANTYVCGGMHIFWQKNGVDNDMGVPTTVDIAQTAENMVTITVTADGYLYNMVRILAGTLVQAGLHRIPPQAVDAILAGRDRKAAGPTLPAKGLFLQSVDYGD